jgi:hypothetical protein
MLATIHDSAGPRWLRWVTAAVPFAMLAAFVIPVYHDWLVELLLGLVASVLLVTSDRLPPLFPPQQVELRLSPGCVEVHRAGLLSQKILTKDLTGASTAATPDGLAITLGRKDRDAAPTVLIVDSEEDARAIRKALGIGHEGFGEIELRATPSGASSFGSLLSVVGMLVGFVGAIVAAVIVSEGWRDSDTSIVYWFAGITAMLGAGGHLLSRGKRGAIPFSMQEDGVHTYETPRFERVIPWHEISGTQTLPYGIMLLLHRNDERVHLAAWPRGARGGFTAQDAALFAWQILSAAQRAHGLGPHKEDLGSRVTALRRGGDKPRAWLARVDVMASALTAGAGYRGASIDVDDLWAVLEDPDAEEELRIAAARMLSRADAQGSRVRIDAAIATVHDDKAARRLRVAITDAPDAVAEAVEELVEEEDTKAKREASLKGR